MSNELVDGLLKVRVPESVKERINMDKSCILRADTFAFECLSYPQWIYDLVMDKYNWGSVTKVTKLTMFLVMEANRISSIGRIGVTTASVIHTTLDIDMNVKTVRSVLNTVAELGFIELVSGLGAHANGECMFITAVPVKEVEPVYTEEYDPTPKELPTEAPSTPASDKLGILIDKLMDCHTAMTDIETGALGYKYAPIIKLDTLKKIQELSKQLHDYTAIA